MSKKPELTLMPVDMMNDADAIVAFFTKVMGFAPSQADIDELRAEMAKDAANDQQREQ